MAKNLHESSLHRAATAITSEVDGFQNQYEREIRAVRDQKKFDRESETYESELLAYIKKKFRSTRHFLRKDFSPDYPKIHYYVESLMKRRERALVHCMPEAVRRFAGKYPALNIEYEMAALNDMPTNHNYDLEDAKCNFDIAIALYILDELDRAECLVEAFRFFPPEEEYSEMLFFPEDFHVAGYDLNLIAPLIYLIRCRNQDEPGYGLSVYLDKPAACRTEENVTSSEFTYDADQISAMCARDRLDIILSYLPAELTDDVVHRFEEKLWAFFDAVLESVSYYRDKELSACDELLGILQESRDARNNSMGITHHSPDAPLCRSDVSVEMDDSEAEKLFARLNELNALAEAVGDKRIDYEDKQNLLRILSAGAAEERGELLTYGINADIIERLAGFSVDDPYETCFAFFWLLDKGNDLPWLVNLGSGVVSAAARALPWVLGENFDPEIAELEKKCPAYRSFDAECGAGIPKEEVLARTAELYSRKYIYSCDRMLGAHNAEPETSCINLPQFIFSRTGFVLPRLATGYEEASEALDKYGFQRDFPSLLTMFLRAVTYATVTRQDLEWYYQPFPGSEDEVQEEETYEEDTELLHQEIRELRQTARGLEGSLAEAERQVRERQKQIEQMGNEHEAERRELITLRELVYQLNNSADVEPEPFPPEISFPYMAKHQIVVFGGHESWRKAIRPMLPNVRFIPGESLPVAGIIRSADMVWIQTNAISHDRFYKIADVVRTNKIPLCYFVYSSAEKCARQLVAEDLK